MALVASGAQDDPSLDIVCETPWRKQVSNGPPREYERGFHPVQPAPSANAVSAPNAGNLRPNVVQSHRARTARCTVEYLGRLGPGFWRLHVREGTSVPVSDQSELETPRVLLVCREQARWGQDAAMRRALARHLSIEEYIVDEGWPDSAAMLGGLKAFDAVIWFVRFRELRLRPAFDWAGYEGLRLMYEWDACQDFSRIASGTYVGTWAEVFRRHRFDVLVCTGRRTRGHLRAQGVDAEWIPKGADHETFRDLGLNREGLCTFGAPYPARHVVLGHLRRTGVVVEGLSASPVDLNVALNRHLGCVICNAELTMPLRFAKVLVPVSGGRIPVLAEGPEPMAKNFEVAASGTAPVCDELGELAELGFIDGSTAVLYRSLTELTEKVRSLLADPGALRTIGQNAAELVRTRHTWEERGADFASLISSRLGG